MLPSAEPGGRSAACSKPRAREGPSGIQVARPSQLEKVPEETDPPPRTSVTVARGLNYTTERGRGCRHHIPGTLQVTGSSSGPKAS